MLTPAVMGPGSRPGRRACSPDEPTSRREAPPDDKLREIRESWQIRKPRISLRSSGLRLLLSGFCTNADACGYGSWLEAGTTRIILAARCARALRRRPRKQEGAGKAGCALHPRSRVQLLLARRHTSIQVQRRHSDFPCALGYGLYRALPGDRAFFANVIRRKCCFPRT